MEPTTGYAEMEQLQKMLMTRSEDRECHLPLLGYKFRIGINTQSNKTSTFLFQSPPHITLTLSPFSTPHPSPLPPAHADCVWDPSGHS